MKTSYTEIKIREALKQVGGSQTRAIQLVMGMAMDDPQLMSALAKPHLKGIVAHAVGRTVNNMGKVEEIETPEAPESEEHLIRDGKADEFGLALLKAVAGAQNPEFGHEKNAGPVPKRGKASKRHIDAINYMASKNTSTKK